MNSDKELRISVVIPAHCTEARHGVSRLRLTLLSLTRQTLPTDAYEVILVDNASEPPLTPQVAEWGLAGRVLVVRREKRGLAAGYNAGVARVRAPLTLLGTDDELASPQLLEAHVTGHEGRAASLVVGHCLTLFHTQLFRDVRSGGRAPDALERTASRSMSSWLPGATEAMGLLDKPLTDEDVLTRFDRVVALAGLLPEFEDIERTIRRGRCHSLPGGWMAMRLGNHSLPTDVLRELGGLDERLDAFGSWYVDLELGIRLCDAAVAFRHAPKAVSVNADHPRGPGGIFGVVPAMAHLLATHPRMDVALSPLAFQHGLRIAEYARFLRSCDRSWPPHWSPAGGAS